MRKNSCRDWLQNDVHKPRTGQPVFRGPSDAAGEVPARLFSSVQARKTLLLDTEADGIADLKRRLSMYRLRSNVSIDIAPEGLAVLGNLGTRCCQSR